MIEKETVSLVHQDTNCQSSQFCLIQIFQQIKIPCIKCLEYVDFDVKIVGLQKAIDLVLHNDKKRRWNQQNLYLFIKLKQLKLYWNKIRNYNPKSLRNFDQLINILRDWIVNPQQQETNNPELSLCGVVRKCST